MAVRPLRGAQSIDACHLNLEGPMYCVGPDLANKR